jgi:hypothetical protein
MSRSQESRRDWRISAILLIVWIVALFLLTAERDDIPVSMLAMATVFFVLLIPSMNDLVRSIERRTLGQGADPDRDPTER